MTSHPSLKPNFLYPKFLKPVGATAIANVNPLSLFPDGIPGYIAPKNQNFADSPFFFDNRSITITEPSYTPKVQSKNKTSNFFPSPSATQQELNSETHNIPEEDGEIDNFNNQDRKIQKTHQHPTINLKSNIQSNFSSNLPEVHLPNNETTTPSVENPIINQETVTPKSDTVADVPSVHQVPNKNNSSSTPKITSHSKPPTAPFSFINLLRKAVDFFSNNNLPVAKKEEHDNRRSRAPDAFLPEGSSGSSASAAAPPSASPKGRSPVLFPDIISSKSQTDNNINRETDLSVPDSWSSITELINESYSTNNSLNAKSEKNKNIDRAITKSNNIFSIEKRHESSSSNTPKINQNNDRINILNKKKDALISNDLNIYQIQLKTNKSNYSRYQYQPLNSNITSSKKTSKTLSGKPSIQEVNNFTLSLKEETPAENKTLNNDTETTTNETELLDILAGEIYNLLQQRLELERERQGKYYI